MKKTKKIWLSILIVLSSILALALMVYFLLFNTYYLGNYNVSQNMIDNTYNNMRVNHFSMLESCGDRVYYTLPNRLFKNGMYEITDHIQKRIYWNGSLTSGSELISDYSFMNKLLGYQIQSVDGRYYIDYFDTETGEYVRFLELTCLSGEKVDDFFTLNHSLYYTTQKAGNIYRYGENGYQLAASNSICGGAYCAVGFYKDNLYYYLLNNSDTFTIYRMNLFDRSPAVAVSFDDETIKDRIYDYCFLDDFFLYVVNENDYNFIYSYDFSDKKTKHIMTTTESVYVNGYHHHAFWGLKYGDEKGLYSYTTENGSHKIFNSYVNDVYIIDTDTVYFTDDNWSLYRVTHDGEFLNKFF